MVFLAFRACENMPQLLEARGAHENWTGLKDAKTRRRLQNRLNVRAHRKRKARNAHGGRQGVNLRPVDCIVFYEGPPQSWRNGMGTKPIETLTLIWASPLLRKFCAASTFPLSADHLIPLIQYNLLRATLTNMSILSRFHTLPDKHYDIWGSIPLFPAPMTVPDTLTPTEQQERTPHDFWIDLLPDPAMRDNVIKEAGTFDPKDLCLDLLGRMCHGENTVEITGILVWCDPWQPEGWEVTEGFARKWGFLLKGCWKMLHAANKWRALRGEEPLVIDM